VDKDGVIIIGHLRRAAAKMEGLTEVPVHIAAELSPERVKALRLADNRVGQEAEWEFEILSGELLDLKALEFDLLLTGFDADEILRLSDEFQTTPENGNGESEAERAITCPECGCVFSA
jgi:ParB-like chromosome segregation protein Spo0J